jgi:hypothetical protein
MRGIAVINQFAERGVALIQDNSKVLTKDEQQRQFLLQVVEWHQRPHTIIYSEYIQSDSFVALVYSSSFNKIY